MAGGDYGGAGGGQNVAYTGVIKGPHAVLCVPILFSTLSSARGITQAIRKTQQETVSVTRQIGGVPSHH